MVKHRHCLICLPGTEDSPPVLVTKYGQLMGKNVRVKETTRTVSAYLGIPFAEPPLNQLRFAPSQPPKAWTGLRDATVYPPLCLQDLDHAKKLSDLYGGKFPPLKSSEDCLYLNIYSPVKPGDSARLPVMVWIHGGGYLLGGASCYDGSSLAALGSVVVVAIQYRLGILGFLSTGSGITPENVGMLDQVFALQWIQENIASFGGDPEAVTIFGESAGGMSVFFHMLSPKSSGLFHRAICQSGVGLFPMFWLRNPKPAAQVIARSAGCFTDDSAALLDCFRNKTSEEIVAASATMGELLLMPSLDGEFIPKNPEELLQEMAFNNVPYIIGMNNHEFGWMLPFMFPPRWDSGMTRETTSMILSSILKKADLPTFALEIINDEYFGDMEDPIEIRQTFVELLSDMLLGFPAIKTTRYHSDAGFPVYFYEFQHRPSVYRESRPEFVKADHFDEVGFVFGAPFWTEDIQILNKSTAEERELSRTMIKYWTNFAKNGNPNGDGLLDWPTYTSTEEYMQFNLNLTLNSTLKKHRLRFWTEVFPKKIEAGMNLNEHAEL
ncbi:SASB hydrolase, partial [Amia calva]|nr:SASB hydrolase [Amia calva]